MITHKELIKLVEDCDFEAIVNTGHLWPNIIRAADMGKSKVKVKEWQKPLDYLKSYFSSMTKPKLEKDDDMNELRMGTGTGITNECSCLQCVLKREGDVVRIAELELKANTEARMRYAEDHLWMRQEKSTSSSSYKAIEVKTLRDEFAMNAMTQILKDQLKGVGKVDGSNCPMIDQHQCTAMAVLSYWVADAMLKVRDVVKSPEASKG